MSTARNAGTTAALPLWQRLRALLGNSGGDGLPVRLSSRNYAGTRDGAVRDLGFDQPLAWVAVALLAWGLVMVYSASVALPDNPRFANYAHTHFLIRHTFSIAVGLIAALVAFQFPLRAWERMAPWLFALALLLLVLVLIPFIGKGVNGARRWLNPLQNQATQVPFADVDVPAFSGGGLA